MSWKVYIFALQFMCCATLVVVAQGSSCINYIQVIVRIPWEYREDFCWRGSSPFAWPQMTSQSWIRACCPPAGKLRKRKRLSFLINCSNALPYKTLSAFESLRLCAGQEDTWKETVDNSVCSTTTTTRQSSRITSICRHQDVFRPAVLQKLCIGHSVQQSLQLCEGQPGDILGWSGTGY